MTPNEILTEMVKKQSRIVIERGAGQKYYLVKSGVHLKNNPDLTTQQLISPDEYNQLYSAGLIEYIDFVPVMRSVYRVSHKGKIAAVYQNFLAAESGLLYATGDFTEPE